MVFTKHKSSLAIRLAMAGVRNSKSFRVVVAPRKSPRDGRFVERIGHFNPRPTGDGKKIVAIDFDRAKYWMAMGAQPTERVARLFGLAGILPPFPKRVFPGKDDPRYWEKKKNAE